MATLRQMLQRIEDRAGQALVEYALILTLVTVVLILIVIIIGNQAKNLYCNVSGGLGT